MLRFEDYPDVPHVVGRHQDRETWEGCAGSGEWVSEWAVVTLADGSSDERPVCPVCGRVV